MWLKKKEGCHLNTYKSISDVYKLIKNKSNEELVANIKIDTFLMMIRVVKKMGASIEENRGLIERLRLLEIDSKPDGYPVVKMKDITSILNIIDGKI